MTTPFEGLSPRSVKICGNRDPKLCRLAVEAGADLLGFIFVPGARRYTTPQLAAECLAEARRNTGRAIHAVGVFINERTDVVRKTADIVGLDLVQLHGSETPESLVDFDLPLIKALRPKPVETIENVRRTIESYLAAKHAPIAFLIDGYHDKHQGGSGSRADWKLASEIARDYPLVLAGGLTPENVGVAVETVCPFGVDVSSGVETAGVRDPAKIRLFVEEAKTAFAKYGIVKSA